MLLAHVIPVRYVFPKIGKQQRKQTLFNFSHAGMVSRPAKSRKMSVLFSYRRTERHSRWDGRNEKEGKTCGRGGREGERMSGNIAL